MLVDLTTIWDPRKGFENEKGILCNKLLLIVANCYMFRRYFNLELQSKLATKHFLEDFFFSFWVGKCRLKYFTSSYICCGLRLWFLYFILMEKVLFPLAEKDLNTISFLGKFYKKNCILVLRLNLIFYKLFLLT